MTSHPMRRLLAGTLAAFLLMPGPALADGIVIKPSMDGWSTADENSQQALIMHRDGIEQLTVAIVVDDANAKGMVWLLPVPALPERVKVDVVAEFPAVRGSEVFHEAYDHLGNTLTIAAYMQIWPPVVGMFFDQLSSPSRKEDIAKGAPAPAAPMPAPSEVVVHERVEKEGMVLEVVTAREGDALYRYLAGKGLKLTTGAIPALDTYLGKEYTFVAAWFAATYSAKDDPATMKGLQIRFPTAEMFFPLLPTSAYGDRVVPATIRVAGHVTPRVFAAIAPYTAVDYYVAYQALPGAQGLTDPDLYTKIAIDARAKAFTQDLWISPELPPKAGLGTATFIVRHKSLVAVLLLLASSIVASVVAGWMVYSETRTKRGSLRLALVGMANCFTLVGLVGAAITWLADGWKRRTVYVAVFSILFLIGMTFWNAPGLLMPPPTSTFAAPLPPPVAPLPEPGSVEPSSQR
jgi:hypothetical protein